MANDLPGDLKGADEVYGEDFVEIGRWDLVHSDAAPHLLVLRDSFVRGKGWWYIEVGRNGEVEGKLWTEY
jgi:hypothetical protein